MDELVGAFQALDQSLTHGVPKRRVDLLLRRSENDRKHRDPGDIAEAGQLLQRRLRFGRQASDLADHEVHHVFGVTLGVNAIAIPEPARCDHDRSASKPSSASAYRNWMAKNGLPAVFSCTTCASGAARSGSQRSASAIN